MASFNKCGPTGKKLARQIEFDGFVQELLNEGSTMEIATSEAIELFSSEFDLSMVFVYQNTQEATVKYRIESFCNVIEAAATNKETFVNASFALQGLLQTLMDKKTGQLPINLMAWRFCEARRLPALLVGLLHSTAPTSDEEETEDRAACEDDSDNDDDNDDHVQQAKIILDSFIQLAEQGIGKFLSPEALFTLDEECIRILCTRLDDDAHESIIVNRIVSVLSIILSQDYNRQVFLSMEGPSLLSLVQKMYKSNAELVSKIVHILNSL